MDRRRVKLILQYDGAEFLGWQSQKDGGTVQQAVEGAIEELTGRPARVHAAGRTDAGVHAAAMPVHFDLEHPIPAERLPVALNRFLPASIGVLAASKVAPDFDARRRAILRWYRYQARLDRLRRPLAPRAWQTYQKLDLEAIEQGLALLRGTHDFCGFRSSQCQARRTELTLEQATMRRAGDLIAFDFKCRSFLHHMIRFMVGTLVSMGEGKLDEGRMLRILEHGERPQLILCAPPEGLCLMGVAYDEAEREAMLAADPAPPSF